jgi:hypothetical protein
MNKIQLTEDEFYELECNTGGFKLDILEFDERLLMAKEQGYIKKSLLEEAEELYKELMQYPMPLTEGEMENRLTMLRDNYSLVIKELQEK